MIEVQWIKVLGLLASLVLTGCSKQAVRFVQVETDQPDARAFDTDDDGRADYVEHFGPDGRVVRIGYDTDGSGESDHVVTLDETEHDRHVVLILDGVGFEAVGELRKTFTLSYLHPPSRLVGPFPSTTNPAMTALLSAPPPPGFDRVYYDRFEKELVGERFEISSDPELPFEHRLDFRYRPRPGTKIPAGPEQQFRRQLGSAAAFIAESDKPELRVYLATPVGLGNPKGLHLVLSGVDDLVRRIVWSSRGRTAVTVLSGLGRNLQPVRRASIRPVLKRKGWRVTDRLESDKDVVTRAGRPAGFAQFWTKQPALLATDLTADVEGVELASYVEWDAVVVLAPDDQAARIHHRNGRFRYEALRGDPLNLSETLAELSADKHGFYNARDLLEATARSQNPAPLQRLWRAHLGRLVQHPPDVLVSLKPGWYWTGFRLSLPASTQGSLGSASSTGFVGSTLDPLPTVLRDRDVPTVLGHLQGIEGWPVIEK